MSDFALPISRLTSVGQERCTYCDSAHTQAVLDTTKCLECGGTWVTGSGLPVYRGPSGPDLLYTAWSVIANVSEGDWVKQTTEWRTAAEHWRDQWHQFLRAYPEVRRGVEEPEQSAEDPFLAALERAQFEDIAAIERRQAENVNRRQNPAEDRLPLADHRGAWAEVSEALDAENLADDDA